MTSTTTDKPGDRPAESGRLAPVTALPTVPGAVDGLAPPPVDVGDGRLTAAYCAERAAAALHRAEAEGGGFNGVLLVVAEHWRHLAVAMSQNIGLARPPKTDNDNRR